MGARRIWGAVGAAALLAASMTSAPASAGSGYALLMGHTETGTAPLRWNPCQTAITYKVNTTYAHHKGSTASEAATRALSEVRKAMGKVAAATGLPFQYAGTTSIIPTGTNWYTKQNAGSEIVIAYADQDATRSRSSFLGGTAWGQGGQVYAYEGSRLVVGRGFVVIDGDKTKRMDLGFGPGTHRGNIVLHELGHVVGLDHVSSRSQLMYPTLSDSSPDGYAWGDLAGLKRLGASAGCIKGAADLWPGS
ncbi:MAG: matrixin family metalloprotease [Candidatus Nanopelagicales bacterium]